MKKKSLLESIKKQLVIRQSCFSSWFLEILEMQKSLPQRFQGPQAHSRQGWQETAQAAHEQGEQ